MYCTSFIIIIIHFCIQHLFIPVPLLSFYHTLSTTFQLHSIFISFHMSNSLPPLHSKNSTCFAEFWPVSRKCNENCILSQVNSCYSVEYLYSVVYVLYTQCTNSILMYIQDGYLKRRKEPTLYFIW